MRSRAPTPLSIIEWAERRHQIRVEVWELNHVSDPAG
jgi:hypothetical protein